MARESRNAVKIEGWRLSRVPIDQTESIFQGDMLAWNASLHQATKLTGTSGAQFMGIADKQNPEPTFGVLTSDIQTPRMNVIQAGLVELEIGENVTLFPFDLLTSGTDAQTVLKTGANTGNQIGFADMIYNAAGTAVVTGTRILVWLTVPNTYLSLR